MDYADAVHPGVKLQLEWALKQKEEITEEVIKRNPLSSPVEDWPLRFDLHKFLKLAGAESMTSRVLFTSQNGARPDLPLSLSGAARPPSISQRARPEPP